MASAQVQSARLLSLKTNEEDKATSANKEVLGDEARTHASAPAKKAFDPQVLLTDLRDSRLSVEQVKQQSVNLFMEATRTVVSVGDKPLLENPRVLTAGMVQPSKTYLPPRKDWLVFYVNTLEPIIHLLNEDMKETERNGLQMPEPLSKKITPLWKVWREDVLAIDKAMDDLQELIGPDKGTNIGIAKDALTIFERATHMEKIRYQAAQICQTELTKMKAKTKTETKSKTEAETKPKPKTEREAKAKATAK